MEAQQPTDMDPFKTHLMAPSDAAAEMTGAKVFVPTLGATNNGRLRAMPPKAPKALLAKRHTVRQQDSEDRPMQRVITMNVSVERES